MLLGLLVTAGCTTPAPRAPRFVTVYDQDGANCRIAVVRDTRSAACFVAVRCGRHAPAVVAVDAEVCVP